MDETQLPMTLGERLAWIGLVFVTGLCFVRAMIEHDPFPWWQSDPFVFSPPIIGLTPRWALLLNIGLVVGSVLSLLGHAMRGRGISRTGGILLTIALGVLAYHAGTDLERLLDASTIIAVASVLACVGMSHTLPGAARLLGSLALGFALMLVSVGFYEVYISHPITIRAYDLNRDSFLAARGWTQDSFEAMSYERRLRNPEPIAWFGLTNVFASFAAGSGAGLVGIAINASSAARLARAMLLAGACVCIFGLVMSGSKGGYGVLALGVMLSLLPKLGWERFLNGRVILLLCGGVLGALLLRGLAGEHLGERSLLFRWQYMVGSLAIWLHHPLWGCGPGLFQEQYALLKPALSPEDVASAHHFMFDWIAVSGIAGLALVGFVVRQILGLRSLDVDEASDLATQQTAVPEWQWKLGLLLIALPTLLSLKMQAPILGFSAMLPILLGAVLWACVSMVLMWAQFTARAMRMGLMITAAALIVHGMLEVTGTLITSAPLWALMIAVSFGGNSELMRRWRWLPIISMLGVAAVLAVRWSPLNRWEQLLHSAAWPAPVIASINTTLNALESSPNPAGELQTTQSMIHELTGRPVGPDLDSIIPELNRAEVEARQGAIEQLRRALDARAGHTPTRIALSQQLLWIASIAQSSGREDLAARMWEQATGLFEFGGLNASGERWAGNIWSGRAASMPQSPERLRWLENARDHWERAIELAPHSPRTAFLLMENALERNEQTDAQGWAYRTVELHKQTRLDPLRGLRASDLQRAEAEVARSSNPEKAQGDD